MIPGYNHNVKYNDQVYHVQTEDSGRANPHIITHLFIGGNIIESRKTSYADLNEEGYSIKVVVDLMQNQHKAMLKDLIRGQLDEQLASRSVNAAKLDGPAPLNVDAGQHKTSFGIASDAPVAAKPVAAPEIPKPAPPVPAPAPEPVAASPSSFFGDAPAPPTDDQVIDAQTLERAFESKDEAAVDSIFGEDLISEKSLDEVILSYLAEDMTRE